MRRLFSTFATGLPGAGLLIMRLSAGGVIVTRAIAGLAEGPAIGLAGLLVFAVILGVCLLAGLWTPVVGSLVAAFELGSLSRLDGDPWTHTLLATLAIALALVGPGVWSIDARLFGWKRIDIPDRLSRTHASWRT